MRVPQPATARRRGRPGRLTALAVVAALLAVPVLAADESAADDPRPRSGLLASRAIERRAGLELEAFSALDRLERAGVVPTAGGIDRDRAARVERAMLRATGDHLAERMIDLARIETRLDRVLGRDVASSSRTTDAGEAGSWHVGLGFRGVRPRLELDRLTAGGSLRLTLSPDGRAALRVRRERLRRTELDAGYDGDGRVHVSCVIGF